MVLDYVLGAERRGALFVLVLSFSTEGSNGVTRGELDGVLGHP